MDSLFIFCFFIFFGYKVQPPSHSCPLVLNPHRRSTQNWNSPILGQALTYTSSGSVKLIAKCRSLVDWPPALSSPLGLPSLWGTITDHRLQGISLRDYCYSICFTFSFSIVTKFTQCKIYHLAHSQTYSPVALSAFTSLDNHHHHPSAQLFRSCKLKLCTHWALIPHPRPHFLATTTLVYVSSDLTLLGTS